jgi:hypothetical protein
LASPAEIAGQTLDAVCAMAFAADETDSPTIKRAADNLISNPPTLDSLLIDPAWIECIVASHAFGTKSRKCWVPIHSAFMLNQ